MTYSKRLLAALLLVSLSAGCGDPFQPFRAPVPEPSEVELIDFTGGDLVDPAAFDLFTGNSVRTDLSNAWDFLFEVDSGLGATLRAREGVVEVESDAGLQSTEDAFDDITEAPPTQYERREPVPIGVGDVLYIRSRQSPSTSVKCRLFGKIEIVAIEGMPARATIRHVVNPNCERRSVDPGEE